MLFLFHLLQQERTFYLRYSRKSSVLSAISLITVCGGKKKYYPQIDDIPPQIFVYRLIVTENQGENTSAVVVNLVKAGNL